MNILSISLDSKIAHKDSAAAQRMVAYGALAENFTIVVLAHRDETIALSDNVHVVVIKKTNKLASLVRLKRVTRELLQQHKYDVITVQDVYFVGWVAVRLARMFNVGLEVQVHGFEKFSGIRKMLAKKVLRNADALRVVSQRLKREVMDMFRVSEDKITVVPIYTDFRFHRARLLRSGRAGISDLGLRNEKKNNDFVFLTVGRLVPVKNIEMQIAALKNIVEMRFIASPKKIELWIVGDGTQRKSLAIKNQKSKIKNQIKFVGWQDDVGQYYSQADAFMLTSHNEGWGLSVVEAAQYGLPIIMTDVGLAGEVIKNGESGIVIPVGDQRALEEAMIQVMQDENVRKKLGEGAREAVKKLLTKEETLALYTQSWQKAASPHKSTNQLQIPQIQ